MPVNSYMTATFVAGNSSVPQHIFTQIKHELAFEIPFSECFSKHIEKKNFRHFTYSFILEKVAKDCKITEDSCISFDILYKI